MTKNILLLTASLSLGLAACGTASISTAGTAFVTNTPDGYADVTFYATKELRNVAVVFTGKDLTVDRVRDGVICNPLNDQRTSLYCRLGNFKPLATDMLRLKGSVEVAKFGGILNDGSTTSITANVIASK